MPIRNVYGPPTRVLRTPHARRTSRNDDLGPDRPADAGHREEGIATDGKGTHPEALRNELNWRLLSQLGVMPRLAAASISGQREEAMPIDALIAHHQTEFPA